MSNARDLADLIGADHKIRASKLSNAPAETKASINALGIAATSLTGSQATAITNNTAKVGITASQATDISNMRTEDDYIADEMVDMQWAN